MATQMGSVSRNKRKLDQIAILNARQGLLPQMLMNQQRSEDLARANEMKNIQIAQFDQQFAQDQERMDFEKKSYRQQKNAAERGARIGMGLEAGKLGLTVAQNYGDKTVGGFAGSIGQSIGDTSFGSGMNPMVSNLSLGSFVGGGLAGYGAAQLMPKKSKKGYKVAAGIGAGALLGGLSGGIGGAISGGIGGGFGGLF